MKNKLGFFTKLLILRQQQNKFGPWKCLKEQRRLLASIARARSEPLVNIDTHVHLDTPQRSMKVAAVWLRHHCQCDKCYNKQTYQRITVPTELESKWKIKELSMDEESVKIIWEDEHVSNFSLGWIGDNFMGPAQEDPRTELVVPATPVLSDLLEATVKYDDFMASDDKGVADALKNIKDFGLTLISGAPAEKMATDQAILRISQPMSTLFGDFWEFESNLAFADTAYTSDYVHLHTDTTYFTEPAGLQVFHCLKHDGQGGLNSLADGFQLAREILENRPEFYELFRNNVLTWQYIDPGKHNFRNLAPIFQHNRFSGQLECIRFNPHDLAPVDTIAENRIVPFYESLIYLSKVIEKNAIWFKLKPGTILIFDNWRMLHGRNQFTGKRRLCGAYVSRSDWTSKARVLFQSQSSTSS